MRSPAFHVKPAAGPVPRRFVLGRGALRPWIGDRYVHRFDSRASKLGEGLGRTFRPRWCTSRGS